MNCILFMRKWSMYKYTYDTIHFPIFFLFVFICSALQLMSYTHKYIKPHSDHEFMYVSMSMFLINLN